MLIGSSFTTLQIVGRIQINITDAVTTRAWEKNKQKKLL